MNHTRAFGRRVASVRETGDQGAGFNAPLAVLCALAAAAVEMSPLCASGGDLAAAMAQHEQSYIRLGELGLIALFYVFGRDVGASRNRAQRTHAATKGRGGPALAERGMRKVLTRLEMRFYLFTRSH